MGSQKLLEIDGGTLEGGGQILRIALGISALTSKPIHITNIRRSRSDGGGLKPQHVACAQWLSTACNGHLTGAERGSKTLRLEPGALHNGRLPAYTERKMPDQTIYESDIAVGRSGSTCLLIQAILPYVLFSMPDIQAGEQGLIRLRVSGGTNVPKSPSIDYLSQVMLPTLQKIGFPAMTIRVERRGWSNSRDAQLGNFVLEIPTEEVRLRAFELWPTDTEAAPKSPVKLQATFVGPESLRPCVSSLIESAVLRSFGQEYTIASGRLTATFESSGHPGTMYLLVTAIVRTDTAAGSVKEYILGRDMLFQKRKVPDLHVALQNVVGQVVSDLHLEWSSGAMVDEYMRDQLVIYQALARDDSRLWTGKNIDGEIRKPSLHAQTAEWLVEKILGTRTND